MVEENINQEFRFKNIDETRSYFLEEIEQNELMSRKFKKIYITLHILNTFLFRFYNYSIYFNFCFYFFAWYSCRN